MLDLLFILLAIALFGSTWHTSGANSSRIRAGPAISTPRPAWATAPSTTSARHPREVPWGGAKRRDGVGTSRQPS